jgi:N-acetylglucosaminyl-diphospho-decaprenol L-rhamnosyltransferase
MSAMLDTLMKRTRVHLVISRIVTPGAGVISARLDRVLNGTMRIAGTGVTRPACVGVAIVTRNRRRQLLETLARHQALPERPPIVVADNGSVDGTAAAVREEFPSVELLELGANHGSAARTEAARRLASPLVAFSDDDSWWEAGALERAARLFDVHPRLGLIAARVLVGPERRLDPTCAAMAASPLPAAPGVPGAAVLGFVACGAIVRRDALLACGGFDRRYGIGGEERLLALDLAAAGWQLQYVEQIVAVHRPHANGYRPGRDAHVLRNDLWSTWLRRPAARVPFETARALARSGARGDTLRGAAAALRGLPWVVRARRPLPAAVERSVRLLERPPHRPAQRRV